MNRKPPGTTGTGGSLNGKSTLCCLNDCSRAVTRSVCCNFIDAAATVTVSGTGIGVRFSRRAHNPLMLNAGFGDGETPIPWLENRPFRLEFP